MARSFHMEADLINVNILVITNVLFTHVPCSRKPRKQKFIMLHWVNSVSVLPQRSNLGPVYTGPDKFLHGRILLLDHLFTWIRANSVAVVQILLQWRSKIRPVPPVPCKRKVEPCTFLSIACKDLSGPV